MAQQTINVGTGVETGDGEISRTAWMKVNANFADLDTRLITLNDRVGNLGNSAARNVGITPGTVADGGDLANEISRAQAAEGTNATAISTETTRAKAAEAALQTAIGQATTSFAVNYTAQSLTSAQQLQARQNISAVASGDNVVLGNGSTATTQAAGDNTTKVATNAFITGAITSYAGTVSSTYLTQANAASTYLTQSNAASIYAPVASPTFTGTPKATTQAAGNNTTALATTAYADNIGSTLQAAINTKFPTANFTASNISSTLLAAGTATASNVANTYCVRDSLGRGIFSDSNAFAAGPAMINKDGRIGRWNVANGYFDVLIDSTSYSVVYNASDETLKENIKPSDERDEADKIERVKFRSFDWKEGLPNQGHKDFGVIAQELLLIEHSWVLTPQSGPMQLDLQGMILSLMRAHQQVSERLRAVEAQLAQAKA